MSRPPGGEAIAAERAWAFEAVESVSRTFALSIDLLEEPMASWVCTGYLLCRVADTVEDERPIPPADRAALLETFDAMLDPESPTDVEDFLAEARAVHPADGGPEWEVLERTDRVVRLVESFDPPVRAAMRSVSREMATGMADFLRRYDDAGGLRLRTVSELEDYCWYVAGTVGKLFTNLMSCHGIEWTTRPEPDDARAFALLLQLVNIAKDVGADRETEGNVYLPGEWLTAEGVDHDAVGKRATPAVARVVERVVDHAADYAPGARRYLSTLPENEASVLEAAALPYLLALGTLRELRARPAAAVDATEAVKLDREEVEALFAEIRTGITQEDLTRLATAVREGTYAPQG